MSDNSVHVTPQCPSWEVKTTGSESPVKITTSQSEAIQIGRSIAMKSGAELIVHRLDGTIRSKDNYGSAT